MRLSLFNTAASLVIVVGTISQVCECRDHQSTSQPSSNLHLPSEQTIGTIEPVFEFYGAMPTGVTVSKTGRTFVNYPRWAILFRLP